MDKPNAIRPAHKGPSPAPSNVIYLDIMYDIEQKEIRIEFVTPEQAKAYQTRNPEARILNTMPKSVWLPFPHGLMSIRSSKVHLMEFCFNSEKNQKAWQKKTLLSELAGVPHGVEPRYPVYIKKEWSRQDLNTQMSQNIF